MKAVQEFRIWSKSIDLPIKQEFPPEEVLALDAMIPGSLLGFSRHWLHPAARICVTAGDGGMPGLSGRVVPGLGPLHSEDPRGTSTVVYYADVQGGEVPYTAARNTGPTQETKGFLLSAVRITGDH